jgi:hypothetical protein
VEKRVGPIWLMQVLKKAERRKEGSWQDVWKELFSRTEGPEEDLAKVQSVKSFKDAIKLLEDLLPIYDRLAKEVALPWREFDDQHPEFAKKAKAANLLAGYILPDMARIVAMERRAQTRLALLKAALVVVKLGPDKLKDIKDPFGTGPFEYRAVGKGFELKSKLVFKGQPVTLMAGKGKED